MKSNAQITEVINLVKNDLEIPFQIWGCRGHRFDVAIPPKNVFKLSGGNFEQSSFEVFGLFFLSQNVCLWPRQRVK